MTSTDIYNISPVTYCHQPGYNALKKLEVRAVNNVPMIIKIVEDAYGFTMAELSNKYRHQDRVRARQIAMYLLRWNTNLTLKEIGLTFGGRDHTTAIHSCMTVRNRMSVDEPYRREVQALECKITGMKAYDVPEVSKAVKPVLKIVRHIDIYSNQKSLYK